MRRCALGSNVDATIRLTVDLPTPEGPVTTTRSVMPPACPTSTGAATLGQPTHVGSLAGVFEIVVHDADQSNRERDRGIPTFVDDALQIGGLETGDVPDRLLVHHVEVALQQRRVRV